MEQNDPGREPEPTDAELLRGRADNLENEGPYAEWSRIQYMIDRRGREYLSGARPMPDTPAPDEVAQLRTEVERLTKGVRSIATMCEQCNGMDEAVTRAWKILHGEQPLGPCSPCEWDTRKVRIADLERENAALVAELVALRNGGSPEGPRPFILTPDGKERKYWAGTKDPGATFPGKEAPDAE